MSEVHSKRCRGCGETKCLEEYHLARLGLHGRAPKCKACTSAWHSANYAKLVADDMFVRTIRTGKSKARYAAMTKEEKRIFMAKIKAHRKSLPNAALTKNLYRALRRRPTENHVTFNELLEIWGQQQGKCALSGLAMTWAQEAFTPTSMSMDRIDWRFGYVKENVRLVCYAVNCFRQRMSDAEMLVMARAIVANMERITPPRPVAAFHCGNADTIA